MYYIVIGAFLFGVAVQTIWRIDFPTLTWIALIGFSFALVARKQWHAPLSRYLHLFALCTVIFVLGVVRTELHHETFGTSLMKEEVGKEVSLAGVVTSDPEVTGRSQRFNVTHGRDTVLVSSDRLAEIAYGDSVTVTGVLEEPDSFETDLGRVFQYKQYLLAKGIEYRISFAEVAIIESNTGNPVVSFLLKMKHTLMAGIETVLLEPQAGLGEGLLLGVKQALGNSLEEDFRRTGIIHIVVLSGYNIMLVVAFVGFVLRSFLGPRLQAVFGIGAIVCFALIVGLSATVVRASIMATLLLVALSIGKNYHVLRALWLAGFVMVFLNPYILMYDIGFQLSFMATLGLILIAPRFETMAATVPNMLSVRDFFFATVATQIAVLPLLLYHIGEVSIVAVLVNMLVLPTVPIAMLFTFLAGLLALFSLPVGMAFGYIAFLSLSYIIIVAEFFASLSFAAIAVPAFSPWWIVALYVIPLVFYFLYTRKNKNDYADWEIVEERSLVKGTGPEGPVPTDEKPIFFR